MKTLESSYGSDTYPSDWSEVIRQQRGKLTGNVTQHRCTTWSGTLRWGEGGMGHLKTRVTPSPAPEVTVEAIPLLDSIIIGLIFIS